VQQTESLVQLTSHTQSLFTNIITLELASLISLAVQVKFHLLMHYQWWSTPLVWLHKATFLFLVLLQMSKPPGLKL